MFALLSFMIYRIALIFRGSKFSRIAVFLNFANVLLNTLPMWLNFEVSKIFAELILRTIPNSQNSQN